MDSWKEWDDMVEGNTLECPTCGALLIGDEPRIVVECDGCENKCEERGE